MPLHTSFIAIAALPLNLAPPTVDSSEHKKRSMKLKLYRKATLLFVSCTTAALLLAFAATQKAQTAVQLPARSGHVNDFANVIDETTRQQLENTLENLKQKTGLQLDVVTVETTRGQDIFDFSQQLAQSWKVIGRGASGKGLLMVVSVKEENSFTQFNKEAQKDLPEGVLGEVAQRLRGHLREGRVGEGVSDAINYFVATVARNRGLNVEDLNAPVAAAATPTPAVSETPADVAPTPQVPAPQVSPEVVPARDVPSASLAVRPRAVASTATNDAETEEVELTLTLPVSARVIALKKFLDTHPDSSARPRALELLISSYAASGDELLKKGNSAAGVEQLLLAISEAPLTSSDKLFAGVISQIPLNLYLRNERAAADKAAASIVAKFGADPNRLLSVAGFYIAIERGDEARQIAMQAIKLAPDLADAHQTLGLALHVSLRLDEAASEYKRALELDPKSKAARRGLADLRRAFGKDEEALALYRELLATDAADKGARAGLVISLLDLGRTDEAKTEMESALQADPKNLPLLSSAAYWFAAHKENELALRLGNQAVELEPRYTWSHVAVARALIAQRNPLAAEGVIRFARQYGKFPTLEYELANTLVSAGLYDEAAEVLAQTFRLNNDNIETRLGGRIPTLATNFIELLTPERQASLFQLAAADSESGSKVLKDLLALTTALNPAGGTIYEPAAVAAARDFSSGNDAARAHRQLYAASRLLQKGVGLKTAFELAEAARTSADAALTVPAVTVAVQADEYRDIRARAIAAGGTAEIADAPANILSNILRGHIEDTSGWALFNLDRVDEAVDHLNRAVNILPAGTPGMRTAQWHLGAALERQGKNQEAISYYIKSYSAGGPDPVRRAVIERLYRRVNGSLDGLDERIGGVSNPVTTPAGNEPSTTTPAAAPAMTPSEVTTAPASPSPEIPAASPSPTPDAALPSPTPAAEPATPATSPATFTVSGNVKDAANNVLANVVVLLISSQGTVLTTTTDDLGNYSFTVLPSNHGFRIIPSRDGFTFEPVDKVLSRVSSEVKDLNFVGTPNPKP
jgi:uncharacterized membrane protein YgcG/tetratricopeptide (TPR) repeat protein